jgi:hypothetical protein
MSLAFIPSPQAEEAKQEKQNAETPITKWIAAENKMLDTLPKQNQKVFFVLRNKHNVIRSVDMVSRDIGEAVKSCASKNKEISTQITTRFKDWQGAVSPILKEADKFLKQELKEQEAFHASDYKHVTKLNDKAFEFSEKQIKKQPVTTLESCQGLLKSMDKSEDKLVSLLQDMLLPEEVVRKRIERQKAAEGQAKDKAKDKAKNKESSVSKE